MDNNIRFYTKVLRFEREFVWPLVGPVTFLQVSISAMVFIISSLLFMLIMPLQVAPVSGFIIAACVWFLYGTVKPDGKRIHRFVVDVLKYYGKPKNKNMGQAIKGTKLKVQKWLRFQE